VTGRKESPFADQIVREDVSGSNAGGVLRLSWSTRFGDTATDWKLEATMAGDCGSLRVTERWTWRSDGSGGERSFVAKRRP
jgi:hypothetical protein